jgi:ABC-type nitrate/sulfonate/bicarbonate transport system substrate-binding protein
MGGQTRRQLLVAGAAGVMATLARPALAQSPTEFVLGLPSVSLGAAMPRLTAETGCFARNGLAPKFTLLDSAALSTAALVSGSIVATQAGPGELIAAQAGGHKAVAIATAYGGMAQSLILSKSAAAKSGVSLTAPVAERLKALRGLTIASASATSSVTVAIKAAAAKMAGVDVRFTYIAQNTMAAALQTGAIDGFLASAPYSTLGVAKGIGVAWVNGPKKDLPYEYTPANAGLLMVMREYCDAHPDIARRMIASFNDFGALVGAQPDKVKAVIARLYPELDPPTLDLFFNSENQAWRAPPPTAKDMAHEIRFVRDSGVPLPGLDKLDPAAMVWG